MLNKLHLSYYLREHKYGLFVGPVLIFLYFILNLIVISPIGNFPLNDDCCYALEVKQLITTGRFDQFADLAVCILHIQIGALVCKLFGFSHTALRITTCFLGLVSTLAVYGCLRELKLKHWTSAIFALTYASNPLFINLCFSFMTDVPALCFANLYFWLCLKGLGKREGKQANIESIGAGLAFIAALAVRQSFIVLLLPSLLIACLYFKKQQFWVVFTMLVLAPLAFIFASEHFIHFHAIYPASYIWLKAAFVSCILGFVKTPILSIQQAIVACGKLGFYYSLFVLPIIFLYIPNISIISKFNKLSLKNNALPLVISGIILFIAINQLVIAGHKLMPFNQNLLRIPMIGPLTLMGVNIESLSPRRRVYLTIFSAFLTFVLFVALGVGMTRLFSHIKKTIKSKQLTDFSSKRLWQEIFCFVSLLTMVAFLVLQVMVRDCDRYYLMALAPMLFCLALIKQWQQARTLAFLCPIILVAFATYSTLATSDYMNWNRARFDLLQKLEAQGIPYKQIDGGYEYNYYRDPTLNQYYVPTPSGIYIEHRGLPPRDNWRWWAINGEKYIVSFSPVPGYEEINKAPYWSPLSFSTKEVLALKQIKQN